LAGLDRGSGVSQRPSKPQAFPIHAFAPSGRELDPFAASKGRRQAFRRPAERPKLETAALRCRAKGEDRLGDLDEAPTKRLAPRAGEGERTA